MSKKRYVCIALWTVAIAADAGSYFRPAQAQGPETAQQAHVRFDRMTVRQLRNVNLANLPNEQLQGFKNLARDYFMQEIVCPGCSTQAHRRKYELMFAKIAALDTSKSPQG